MKQATRSLAQKEIALKKLLLEMKSVVVALSSGVDSSLTLAAAHDVLKNKAVGAIAVSPSLSPDDLSIARNVSKSIGAELVEVETHEVENPAYQKNDPLRCYFCKHVVYTGLKKIAKQRNAFLVDGFQIDDLAETRPGMRAAREERVRHPLFEAGFAKADVRLLAKRYGLPNWDKAADACLSSRFLTGIPLTPFLVQRIGTVESKVRRILKLRMEDTLRVRHLGDRKARLEVDAGSFPVPVELKEQVKQAIKSFGYANLSFAPYRRGGVSAAAG
jgi:uncharacterized protein